jgi:3-oxoacyl-[acyl-carrier protein] reductase
MQQRLLQCKSTRIKETKMESIVIQLQTSKQSESAFILEGKTAIVTGSGRGIGRAIARRLASAGASVMLNELDEKLLLESKATLPDPDCVRH